MPPARDRNRVTSAGSRPSAHRQTKITSLPNASVRPSGENTGAGALRDSRRASSAPVAASHTRRCLSNAAATRVPSGDSRTAPPLPRRSTPGRSIRRSTPRVAVSITHTAASALAPAANRWVPITASRVPPGFTSMFIP